jgi:hypothetical protein
MTKRIEDNSWETVSGLADDFDFYITRAYFGFRKEYLDGNVALLIWEGESPDEDVTSVIWPLGKGWEVTNRGASVQHPRRRNFVSTSMMGRLIDRVVKELKVDMRSRGKPTDAEPWVGLGFHMKRETIQFGEGILEEKGGKTEHLMPVSVLPERGKPAKPAEKSSELIDKLALLAKALDRQKFQSKAMNMEEVAEDTDLLADILDESEKGFWARHHK